MTMLTTPEAARYLMFSVETLCKWRSQGIGPRYHRVGEKRGRIRYSIEDLEAYKQGRVERGTWEWQRPAKRDPQASPPPNKRKTNWPS